MELNGLGYHRNLITEILHNAHKDGKESNQNQMYT